MREENNQSVELWEGKEIVWYRIDRAPFRIYGLMRTEDDARYCRIPCRLAHSSGINEGIRALYTHTAGGRVRFSTDSPYLAVRCRYNVPNGYYHMTAACAQGFDLYRNGEAESSYVHTFFPPREASDGYTSVSRKFPFEGLQAFTLNFPPYNNVDCLEIGLAPGARLEEGKPYRLENPAVIYGSSITQGGCASRPGTCYTSLLSSWLDMDYVNLGFSGSARGEEEMMEYIASLDMSMFIYDYDHNAPDPEHLKQTHERGFRIVREKNPDLPVIFVTKPDWRPDNTNSTQRRRDVIFHTYANAVAQGDRHVAFVDGRSFFARRDRGDCTVDGCHPNDLGMFRMAERICDAVRRFL